MSKKADLLSGIDEEDQENQPPVFKVFGYGSLLWKVNFNYSSRDHGHIKGFQRKFWQNNKTHRGTEEKPGRVAILHEAEEDKTLSGVMFTIKGASDIEDAKQKLDTRETVLGGYISIQTTFYDEYGVQSEVTVFTATPDNDLYVGQICDHPHDDVEHISTQVVGAQGRAGTNAEYVIKLANYVRRHFPNEDDEHLFLLEKKVTEKLRNRSRTIQINYDHMNDINHHDI
ncbi:glutathione-specific gamma-glutamylcyclotransferase 1-like [Crassostrea angulata]|uniref:glutathione-specific gamma-glutamylcyclotransferase 1-like n=1 Tax=Magallana angulata TaxID=2784310 RepID=UPI0022B1D56D|nr:glutathione-specific gamma-glutamylcyclotransferase 1-like [Crassostrea angulata]